MFHSCKKRLLLSAVFILFSPSVLFASASPIPELEPMRTVGEARMQVLFWDIYDARLLAPGGRFDQSEPFALSLTYLRDLDGEKIAARSIEEMRKQGIEDEAALARWFGRLVSILPDVRADDEIVGLAAADGSTRFYLEGELIGVIEESAFSRAFFAIWLGQKSSEPGLRDQLLGVRP